MERLATIEIEVRNDDTEEGQAISRQLVGEQAKQWMRDHYGAVDDPRVEQDRARELAIVLMAARDSQVDRACTKPDCEGCQVFERGFAWLLGALPEKFQDAIREYERLTKWLIAPTPVRSN